MLNTKEHEDIVAAFDRLHKGRRLDKENREMWRKSIVYQDGHVNTLFLAFRDGYAFAKCYLRD